MKKIFAIVIVVCMLALMGCDAGMSGTTEPNHTEVSPTRPAGVKVVDYDAPALKVKVTINPELELTLSHAHEILEVNALNPDGEALLEDLELIGHAYEEGIVSILAEAMVQGFLENATKVNISVTETVDGGVEVHTADILSQPIREYQLDTGLLFSSQVDCKESTINSQSLKLVEEIVDGNYEFRAYADNSGVVRKHVQINGNDSVVTHYYPNGVGLYADNIQIIEYADGTYDYSTLKNKINSGYTQYPDGTRLTYVHAFNGVDGMTTYSYMSYPDGTISETVYDRDGYVVQSITAYPDGTKHELFLENEQPVRSITYHPDGTMSETQYLYENGVEVGYITVNPDGTTSERHYGTEDGQNNHEYIVNEDGSTYELFYESGVLVHTVETMTDGTVYDTHYYPNGQMSVFEVSHPNGNHATTTYYENGNVAHIISYMENYFFEREIDESERIIYEFERREDGSEYLWNYENGSAKGYTVTYPDGTTEYIPCG